MGRSGQSIRSRHYFCVVDIIRIGGSVSLGSVQIVISLYDENANFTCSNKNYSWWRPKFGVFSSFMWNLLSLGRGRVSLQKAELGMGQKVPWGYEWMSWRCCVMSFVLSGKNITCGFVLLQILETPDSGSDPWVVQCSVCFCPWYHRLFCEREHVCLLWCQPLEVRGCPLLRNRVLPFNSMELAYWAWQVSLTWMTSDWLLC